MHSYSRKDIRSFTLIELLVVLALVAILSVVVILTLNPAELIKQARDSNRLSDLSTINTALNLFSTDVTSGFMGTSTVVYVSIPSASPTCSGVGLPTLPATYTYNCVTAANLRNTNGTGWIPVNFQRISSNSPISQLPIDPINTTTTRLYYTYVSGGSWELNATIEASKNKLGGSGDLVSKDGGSAASQYEIGNNLNLSPLETGDTSLVGYWNFEEGSGVMVYDRSGTGNDGTASGSGFWVPGKIGGGVDFSVASPYITVPHHSSLSISSEITFSMWVKEIGVPTGGSGSYFITKWSGTADANYAFLWYAHDYGCPDCKGLLANMGGTWGSVAPYTDLTSGGAWHHFVATYNSVGEGRLYVDGSLVRSAAATGILATNNQAVIIGNIGGNFRMLMDDLRIYSREFSVAEILALYNAQK